MADTPGDSPPQREITQFRPQVERHIRALVRDPGAAEELTQETFVRALAGLRSLRDPQAALGWLYRVATNASLDYLRRTRTAAVPLEPEAVADVTSAGRREDQPPSLIETALEQTEMSACVEQYLETLPDDHRIALFLHDVHGLSNPEIAELLGCSVATVKIRVHRARRRLRETLEAACAFSVDERGVLVCEPQSSLVVIGEGTRR
jgi:RNA polymerase sigma-70 factor, ECF subfamily